MSCCGSLLPLRKAEFNLCTEQPGRTLRSRPRVFSDRNIEQACTARGGQLFSKRLCAGPISNLLSHGRSRTFIAASADMEDWRIYDDNFYIIHFFRRSPTSWRPSPTHRQRLILVEDDFCNLDWMTDEHQVIGVSVEEKWVIILIQGLKNVFLLTVLEYISLNSVWISGRLGSVISRIAWPIRHEKSDYFWIPSAGLFFSRTIGCIRRSIADCIGFKFDYSHLPSGRVLGRPSLWSFVRHLVDCSKPIIMLM